MKISVMVIGIIAISTLSSCKDEPKKLTEVIKMSESKVSESKNTCSVQDSGDWSASLVKKGESSSSYLLTIEGEVTLPTPGYRANWREGPTDRMNPPSMRLQLAFTEPQQMVIQVLSTKTIKHVIETPISAFRSVIVSCGNEVLAEIKNVHSN
jgi:hypothetical protein